ncbi:MAG: hypothetical protein R3D85_06200 [Paracoccaceae bacterium]
MSEEKRGKGPATRVAGRAGRLASALAVAGALAGCLGDDGTLGFAAKPAGQPAAGADPAKPAPLTLFQARPKPRKAPERQAELVRGKVGVAPPRGYCIDPERKRQGLAGGFVLIASCNSLAGDYAFADVDPAVMTVQAQPGLLTRDLPDAAALATAVTGARVLHRVDGDGLTLVHLDAGGDRLLPAGDPRHWRGAVMVNGYLVGLALYAPKGSPLAGPSGRQLIQALAEATLGASPIPDYSAQAQALAKKKP